MHQKCECGLKRPSFNLRGEKKAIWCSQCLVIDLKRFVEDHPEADNIQTQTQIGTLLVQIDIPGEYLLACLNTDEDLVHFWGS